MTYPEGVRPIETMEKLAAFLENIGTVNPAALIVGAVSLAILIISPYIFKKIPGSLIAVIVGILMVKFLPLKVSTIGNLYTISNALPSFHLPTVNFEIVQAAIPNAFTIAILAAIESLLSCVVADGMIGGKHNSNAELVAQGVGNAASALFGGIPATGAIARTAANIKNGGRSPVAGMVHSLVVLLILLFFMPLAGYIPIPALSSILIMVAYNMSNWQEFVFMAKHAPKSDFTVLMGTFLAGVFVDLLFAVEVGVIISAVLFMRRMSDVASVRSWEYLPQEEIGDPDRLSLRVVPKHTLVYEIEGPVFFATVDLLMNITATPDTKVIVLRMRSVPSMDITALRSMEGLLERCHKKGITLVLSHVMEHPYAVMEKAGFLSRLGEENLCANIDEALARAEALGRM